MKRYIQSCNSVTATFQKVFHNTPQSIWKTYKLGFVKCHLACVSDVHIMRLFPHLKSYHCIIESSSLWLNSNSVSMWIVPQVLPTRKRGSSTITFTSLSPGIWRRNLSWRWLIWAHLSTSWPHWVTTFPKVKTQTSVSTYSTAKVSQLYNCFKYSSHNITPASWIQFT